MEEGGRLALAAERAFRLTGGEEQCLLPPSVLAPQGMEEQAGLPHPEFYPRVLLAQVA